MSSIDNVRVLLQTLPAASASAVSTQSPQPAKTAIAAATIGVTPLRARMPSQSSQPASALQSQLPITPGEKLEKNVSNAPEEFWRDLHQFHERRGTPLTQAAKISGQLVDLYKLYSEVTERGGFNKVNLRDEWDEVYSALETLRERCVNGTAGIKHIYRRYLDKYERLNFLGEDPDKMEALEAAIENADLGGGSSRSRARAFAGGGGGSGLTGLGGIFGAPQSTLTAVPMAYNQRQHIVNLERRRQHKMSTDLHKHSSYEKLMLSLISPLPNEQDFAINVCMLMTNESKHTLRLPDCPKLLDALLAHLGVYSDYTMRQLFQHAYTNVRRHSQLSFWRDLLHDKQQILELYTDEQAWLDSGLITKEEEVEDDETNVEKSATKRRRHPWAEWTECTELDFLNLRRCDGTGDYMGQRVLQIVQIVRSLSFHEENHAVLARSRTLWRYLVMGANVRWSNIHVQALETAGNLAQEFELNDPTTDDLSRNLLATLCEGVDSTDRAVIISCLEIVCKLCVREGNASHLHRFLGAEFYQRLMLLLSLTDVMLLIFTLEAIYALTSLGARPCSMVMQIRGLVDQLVALLTVEAQSYGPEGCILMRVVEIVPGNMLPIVAQNMINMQTAAASTVVPTAQTVLAKPVSLPPPSPAQAHVVQVAPSIEPTPPVPPPIAAPPAAAVAPTPLPPLPMVMPSLPQVQLPPAAIAPPPQPQSAGVVPVTTQSFTHEDEQYALAWLGATYERTSGGAADGRVEQQELYRIYLAHCQKVGKHSVVNHIQFPRLVRLIFNPSVGPVIVRQVDGPELPGTHYIGIRMRSQPMQMQHSQGKVMVSAPSLPHVPPPPPFAAAAPKKDQQPSQPSQLPKLEKIQPTEQPMSSEATEKDTPPPITTTTISISSSTTATNTSSPTPSSSLIKSLLATKVTERQQKQKAQLGAAQLPPPPSLVPTTTTMSTTGTGLAQPIKVTSSTAISAFVNNPLMQHTPVKVGQTTIKPLHPQLALAEKKPSVPIITDSAPPPLAPLSGANAPPPRALIIATANQSPASAAAALLKRKLSNIDDEPIKRLALDGGTSSQKGNEEMTQVTPSKNAANLYADLAASILEDEDLDDVPPLASTTAPPPPQPPAPPLQLPALEPPPMQATTMQQQLQLIPAKMHGAGGGNQQRQLVTIKTDQGLQTVPVILQPKSTLDSVPAPTQTQYVLATNQQGQTYLVAQQAPPAVATVTTQPPTQTLLVTQSAAQQTKTIIILQQPTGVSSATPIAGTQKMLMTTAQGQQVLVTTTTAPQPRPPTPQHQQQQQHHHLHQQAVVPGQAQQIFIGSQQQRASSVAAGQISPSLLSQLNQIPATIKLHQPQPQSVQSPVQPRKSTAIPQLQQHQSIIQQHLISGPSEKQQQQQQQRQVLITQAPAQAPPTMQPQQTQLNSQTIITTQPGCGHQQQQQQQPHPSIIQQKISLPSGQQPTSNPQPMAPEATSKPVLVAVKKQPPLLLPVTTNTPKPMEQTSAVATATSGAASTAISTTSGTTTPPTVVTTSAPTPPPPAVAAAATVPVDVNWLFICDWRNCPRRKFKSLNELQHHVCNVHCPDHLDAAAEIYCQWGSGPSLCDNIPRKRYSLMTHLLDRHLTPESLRASAQRRITTGIHNVAPTQPAVTIVRNVEHAQRTANASPAQSTPGAGASSTPSTNATTTTTTTTTTTSGVGTSALQAIKRHTVDFVNPKELMDENEGPVTKSIRLTAALILRNLVNYTSTAKRQLRRYEPHLANIALSNVESSGTLSHILYELSQ